MVVLGDSGTAKTSIAVCYAKGEFDLIVSGKIVLECISEVTVQKVKMVVLGD